MAQCAAKSKRTHERCKAQAITGRNVCRHHGGKTPLGPASPHWRDGRHSKVLPARLMADVAASLADPERLALNDEISLVDARTNDVLKRVDTGESGALWSQIRKVWREFEDAEATGDTEARARAQFQLGMLIVRGANDWMAWADVLGLIERRRKLVESERKRMVEAREVVAIESAWSMMALLIDAVRLHVRDEETLRAVVGEFAKLTNRPVPTEAPVWNA